MKTILLLLSLISGTANAYIPTGGYIGYSDPVSSAASLPVIGNTDGDVRIALDTKGLYSYDAFTTNWLLIASPAAATAVTALIGDVHCTGPGACVSTIQPNVVSNSKLAQIPALSVKGNNTGALANASDVLMSDLPVSTAQASADAAVLASAIQRANHTGTQLSSTISDFVSAVASAIGYTPENISNKDNGSLSTSSTTYPTSGAVKTYADTEIGGIPSGVYLTEANKIDFTISKDGLLIQSFNTPAFTSGSYNGGGTGSKGFVQYDLYNNLAWSALTDLSFTARNIRDENSANPGRIYWNLLSTFNSGVLTAANDYVNIVIDGLSQHITTPLQYFKLTNSHVAYDMNSTVLATERMVKAVGGTEGVSNVVDGSGAAVASITCTYTSGSAVVTGCSNTASFTVGQYVAADIINTEYSASNKVPPGDRIQSIDSSTQYTLTAPAVASGTVAAFFYGGIAPVSRTVTCSGTTTITAVTNTDDIQANMFISGTGIPANSYVVSKVRNTSLTLNNACTSGTPTVSFIPAGKTGIPGNGVNIGITWAKLVANNPNGKFVNIAPTVSGGWTAADGGYPKNSVQSAFSLVMNGSSTLDSRLDSVKSVTINNDVYPFAK